MRIVMVLGGLGLALAGCRDHCAVGRTRCRGAVMQVCDGEQRWQPAQDCGDILDLGDGGPWACCAGDDAGPECWPAAECP